MCLSHVEYVTGERRDLAAVTARARERGIRVLWDLSHSAGSVPIELAEAQADLAVGCTYKYLNAGPGRAGLPVRATGAAAVAADPDPRLVRSAGPVRDGPRVRTGGRDRRFAAGTPPILGLPLVEIGAGLVAEAGIERLAAKSVQLTEMIIELADEWLAPLGFRVATPRDPARRGAHVSLAHAAAWPICRALIEDAGVIPDYRADSGGDGTIRLGPAPLYTRHVDVWDAMARLRDLVATGRHLKFTGGPGRVT